MNLFKIFEAQIRLDKAISSQHTFDPFKIFSQKKLALLTELLELSNEVKCFKYWSQNKNISKEKILFEYVDCLHFIISIALNFQIEKYDYFVAEPKFEYSNEYVSNYFLKVSADFLLISPTNPESCINAIESFLKLGKILDLTDEEIEVFYFKKNLINYERLSNNY